MGYIQKERNKPGQHRRSADRTVIELISELSKVCPDKAIAAILNRLGYKTGQEKTWNASRVAGVRGYERTLKGGVVCRGVTEQEWMDDIFDSRPVPGFAAQIVDGSADQRAVWVLCGWK